MHGFKSFTCKSLPAVQPLSPDLVSPAIKPTTMVRLSLAAGLAGLAGVAGFQRQAPQRPTTVLQYKKTAKEMRAKYPEGGKVPYVLTKDAPPHGVAGDVLKVNRGFANNYLAPQGLGEPASAEVIAAFEVKLAERAAAEAAAYDAAAAQAQQLIAKGDVSISRAAGEDGEVEAVSAQDVQQVLGLDSSPRSRSRRWTLRRLHGHGHFTQAGEGRAAAEARRGLGEDLSNIRYLSVCHGTASRAGGDASMAWRSTRESPGGSGRTRHRPLIPQRRKR